MTMKALIDSIFKPQVPVEPEPEKPKIPDYVVDSDYKLAAYTALIGPLIIVLSPGKSLSKVDGSYFLYDNIDIFSPFFLSD